MTDHEWVDQHGNEIEDHDRGLRHDVLTLLDRRRALSILGALGVAGVVGACSSGSSPAVDAQGTAPASTGATGTTGSGTLGTPSVDALTEVPDETAGPFPGDGSNGQNVLDDSGIVRSDIRGSFGSSSTVAGGVPLTIRISVKDTATSQAMVGAAVYAWHCDRAGNYSMYSSGFEGENYLRGVQETDDTGTVTFTSIFPGCYPGRWPHVHFEVYGKVAEAVSSGPIVKTSQLALPQAASEAVYATSGYESSVRNLGQLSLNTDNVFSDDGGVHQLATMSGNNSIGWTAHLTIGV
ncbi:MAG TPA: 3,4-dioxygenase subunit beta [Dermatophilaceae bacterium]|nr:3,4-dioxygenase subunit beta [Dermatophilaceae bacterium]